MPDDLLIETSTFFEPKQIEHIVAGVLKDFSEFDGVMSDYKKSILNEKHVFEGELRDLIALDV